MRSLFLKIFLWFWLAMLLVNVALIVSVELTRAEQMSPPFRRMTGNVLMMYAQMAVDVYEREGQAGLVAFMDSMEGKTQVRSTLLDEQGEVISGGAAPAGAQELAKRPATDNTEFHGPGRPPLEAQHVISPRGSHYTLVTVFPPPPPRGSFSRGLRTQALKLFAALLTGGALCYWLARILTAPVIKLRQTTQDLADGNLSARVGPALGKRRDELGSLGRDVDHMAERLESLITAQRRLLGDISHELRSPLARLGVALALARKRTGPEAGGALDRIERESENLNEMIGQLLTLTRLEGGMQGLKNTEVDLAGLLDETAGDADFEASNTNRSVRIVACEPCVTSGRVELLRSAIENVLRNAVRYTAEGTEVDIALRYQRGSVKDYAVISVRDHGSGVPEEALSDIFRPFYRVEDARDRQTGGTGLGLAITEKAISLHGGTVRAANAPDGGLIIEMRIPVERQAAGTESQAFSTKSQGTPRAIHGPEGTSVL